MNTTPDREAWTGYLGKIHLDRDARPPLAPDLPEPEHTSRADESQKRKAPDPNDF
jgi:hypothetical protein